MSYPIKCGQSHGRPRDLWREIGPAEHETEPFTTSDRVALVGLAIVSISVLVMLGLSLAGLWRLFQ
jgi:hypothetical protein